MISFLLHGALAIVMTPLEGFILALYWNLMLSDLFDIPRISIALGVAIATILMPIKVGIRMVCKMEPWPAWAQEIAIGASLLVAWPLAYVIRAIYQLVDLPRLLPMVP